MSKVMAVFTQHVARPGSQAEAAKLSSHCTSPRRVDRRRSRKGRVPGWHAHAPVSSSIPQHRKLLVQSLGLALRAHRRARRAHDRFERVLAITADVFEDGHRLLSPIGNTWTAYSCRNKDRHSQTMPRDTGLPPGTLMMLVLRVLKTQPLHGYAIAQRIRLLSAEELSVGRRPRSIRRSRNCWSKAVTAAWRASSQAGRCANIASRPADAGSSMPRWRSTAGWPARSVCCSIRIEGQDGDHRRVDPAAPFLLHRSAMEDELRREMEAHRPRWASRRRSATRCDCARRRGMPGAGGGSTICLQDTRFAGERCATAPRSR